MTGKKIRQYVFQTNQKYCLAAAAKIYEKNVFNDVT